MDRNEALRPAQAEQTFTWINTAVAKSRPKALQTKDLRRKGLTLDGMTQSIAKCKADVKAQHEALLSGEVGGSSSSAATPDASTNGAEPQRLSAPSFVAGTITSKAPTMRTGRVQASKAPGAPTAIIPPASRLSMTAGRPVVDRSRSRDARGGMAGGVVVAGAQNGVLCPSPAKKGNTASDRVTVFADNASYKQVNISNLLNGEPLGTRLNGVINYWIFFISVFLCN